MDQKRLAQLAWGVWAVCFLIVCGMVIHNWHDHSEGVIYSKAVTDWWGSKNLYGVFRYDGFLYFPHAAILYTPFTFMKHPVGDIAWRFFGLAFLCGGIFRFAKLFAPKNAPLVFAIASFVAILPTLASLRNGQSNLQIAAAMLQAAADLAEKRWWRASLWLMIGVAVKPIMMVMILLAAAVYRPMSWRHRHLPGDLRRDPFRHKKSPLRLEPIPRLLRPAHQRRPTRPRLLRLARNAHHVPRQHFAND